MGTAALHKCLGMVVGLMLILARRAPLATLSVHVCRSVGVCKVCWPQPVQDVWQDAVEGSTTRIVLCVRYGFMSGCGCWYCIVSRLPCAQ